MVSALRLLATAVLIASFFFLVREPISLVWVVVITLILIAKAHLMPPALSPVLVILLCLVSLFWVNSQTPLWGDEYDEKQKRDKVIEEAKSRDLQQREFISKAQYAVKGKLKDPDSAVFSSDYYFLVNGVSFACGQVNAKNSLGAMSGNNRYVSDGTSSGSYVDDGSNVFEETWNLRCKN